MKSMENGADNSNSSQKSLKKNAALNMTKTVMSLVFPLITFPYTSRVLGPAFLGKVHFAQSVVSYFSLAASLGISAYAVRESARLRNDRNSLSVFIKEIFSINMISTLEAYVLFAVALLAVPVLESYRPLLCVCASSILFATLGMDYLYTGLEEFKYITIRSIAFQFLSLVLLFVFVRSQDDYLKYAAVSVVSSAGSNILNFFHTRHFVDFRAKAQNLKKHLKPVFTLFAMSAAVSIYTVLDTTMLGFLKGDEAVGFYTAATKINRLVIMMITAATAVLLPRLSFYADKDRSEFLRLSNKALQFVVMFSVPCATGLFILAEPVIVLFSGGGFLPSVPVMKIINAVIVMISISGLLGIQVFISVGKERLTLVSVIAGAVVNFTLNMILIPLHGAAGAAVATVVAECTVTALQLAAGKEYFKGGKNLIHAVKVCISAFVMSMCVFAVCKFFNSYVLKIFFGLFSGIFSYGLCLWLLKDRLFAELLGQAAGKICGRDWSTAGGVPERSGGMERKRKCAKPDPK